MTRLSVGQAGRMIYVPRGHPRVCYVKGVSRRPTLTPDEAECVRRFDEVGMTALRGEKVWSDYAEEEPRTGWVLCFRCKKPMPAGKVEECVPTSLTRLFMFFHTACYGRFLSSKSDEGIPRAPSSSLESDRGAESPRFSPKRVWDLDAPDFSSYD
eukprot:jgi/Mesvir1/10929/Mv11470-RA.1